MFRAHFLWRLYLGYVVLILFTTICIGILLARRIETDSLQETEKGLRHKTLLLRELSLRALRGGNRTAFRHRITSLGRSTKTRLTVIADDGTVIADSEEDAGQMDNHGTRPEILEARTQSFGLSTRLSRTVKVKMMYLALKVEEDGDMLGYVRAALPLTEIENRLAQLRKLIMIGASIATAIALFAGFFFAKRITNPLTSMTQVAKSIASGDYKQRLQVQRSDEVGTLAMAFNSMAEQLQQRIQMINADKGKLAAILASMVEGVIAVDQNECIVHMNTAAGSILGIDPGTVVAKPVWGSTRIHEISEIISRAMRTMSAQSKEVRLPASSGEKIMMLYASPLREEGGEVIGAIVVMHDVSELRKLETIRKDFLSNVSHELKTPLTAIYGFVETILDDPSMNDQTQHRFLGKIRAHSRRLRTLVSDLLTISRMESGEELTEMAPIDLAWTVHESVESFKPQAESSGRILEYRQDKGACMIRGDAEALRQVVDNLLDNAMKYTPRDGAIKVCLTPRDQHAVLTVMDNGIGIAQAHQDRIFERFYRVDKARSRELGGTGLGLSIVKHIVLMHNGTIALASTPGEGSTFTVSFPLVSA